MARAFFELFKITSEPDYQIWAERLVRRGLQRRNPETHVPSNWDTVSPHHSSAAVIDLLVEIWAFTGRQGFLASAQRAVRQLLNKETSSGRRRNQRA
jgi:hypothetical protein